MLEKIEQILNVLRGLKEDSTKRPFFTAPEIDEVLLRIGKFMSSELDSIIQTAEELKAELEESA